MASPASDDVACFDSLPNDLVGVIMGKLDFESALRLTQASPTARRLVQGERAVPGVLGTVVVHFPLPVDEERDLQIKVDESCFELCKADAATGRKAKRAPVVEDDAERQPSACIVHLFEWIRVRARAFTEIIIIFEGSISHKVLNHIASAFLPNVPSSFRGKISFEFISDTADMERLLTFLATWRALSPAYGCGLMLDSDAFPSDLFRALLRAAPPLSSLTVPEIEGPAMPGFDFLKSLDNSRLTKLNICCWTLTSFPSQDVLPPAVEDLSLDLPPGCWRSLTASLTPLHRLTALTLSVGTSDGQLDSTLTLAPFTVLPNLRLFDVNSPPGSYLEPPPAVEDDYWRETIVLPAVEELSLRFLNDPKPQGGKKGPAAGQPSRWPSLLSNLEAPKLKKLYFAHEELDSDHDRTLDLPLGRFPRLEFFFVSTDTLLDLPALRAEIATLRHLQLSPDGSIQAKLKEPVPEKEAKAWELELGLKVTQSRTYGPHIINLTS